VKDGFVPPHISVIIPVHNEGGLLRTTIDAVCASRTQRSVEIIVVDDGSVDSCCDFLRNDENPHPEVRLVTQGRAGVARSRNRGAERAAGEVLVFLDAHCTPGAGWLDRLSETLYDNPAALVAPCMTDAANPRLKGFGVRITDRSFRYRWLPRVQEGPYPIPVAAGGCLAVRREFFWGLGGFENMRTYGHEDVDLSIRCWTFGHSVLVVPDAEVAHVFRPRTNLPVSLADYVHNALRLAVLHFDGSRLERILAELKASPAFAEAAALLLALDIWDRRHFIRSRRTRDGDWYCERFEVSL
jgi:GT2 family glycosyltransferase